MPTAKLVPAHNSALSSVAASASSQTLVGPRAGRKATMVYNDSTVTLYLSVSDKPSSTSSFTAPILAGGYYEVPIPGYDGAITGVWSSATGSARITELY